MQRDPKEKGVYEEHYSEETIVEYCYDDETTYNHHPNTHVAKPHNQFNRINNNNHGYGPHNDPRRNERERFSMQYSENMYEEERRADAWNKRNDYNAPGGKHNYNGNNGYPQGQYGPHRNQAVPVWVPVRRFAKIGTRTEPPPGDSWFRFGTETKPPPGDSWFRTGTETEPPPGDSWFRTGTETKPPPGDSWFRTGTETEPPPGDSWFRTGTETEPPPGDSWFRFGTGTV